MTTIMLVRHGEVAKNIHIFRVDSYLPFTSITTNFMNNVVVYEIIGNKNFPEEKLWVNV
jgi:hypothetical protein